MRRSSLLALSFPLLFACSSSDGSTDEPNPEPQIEDPGLRPEGFDFNMASVEYTLAPGEERYICTTMTVDQAINFNRWKIGDYVGVHHMFLAHDIGIDDGQTTFECPELFRPTWLPLFTTGAGKVTLDLPEATAFHVDAGERLVMQLHLVNATPNELTEQVDVFAKTITDEEKRHDANLFAFGTTIIDIPARSAHEIVHDCTVDREMEAFVVMPHMHQLGTDVVFETGMTEDTMEVAYEGIWDFDDQQLIPEQITFRPGMHTRLRCRYDNPHDFNVIYGESSFEEMCFFSIFAKDIPPLQGDCVDITNLDLSQFGL